MKPRIEKISIPGLTINARVWGADDGQPLLAMHGWLDNAATFDFLAPLMPGFKIVAIDFPGHGFSDALPPSGHYHYLDRVLQMMQVVDALGWDTFSILGHSMGGLVGTGLCALFPERVKKIAIIDVVWNFAVSDADVTRIVKHYYLESTKERKPHRVYENYEYAAKVRASVNKKLKMKESSALMLAKGGMEKVEGGYSWTFDTRLLLPHIITMTNSTIKHLNDSMVTPLCLVLGSEGFVRLHVENQKLIESMQNAQAFEVPGGHYIHLDAAQEVAPILNRFYAEL